MPVCHDGAQAITHGPTVPLRAKLCLALDWNNARTMREVLAEAQEAAAAAAIREVTHVTCVTSGCDS